MWVLEHGCWYAEGVVVGRTWVLVCIRDGPAYHTSPWASTTAPSAASACLRSVSTAAVARARESFTSLIRAPRATTPLSTTPSNEMFSWERAVSWAAAATASCSTCQDTFHNKGGRVGIIRRWMCWCVSNIDAEGISDRGHVACGVGGGW